MYLNVRAQGGDKTFTVRICSPRSTLDTHTHTVQQARVLLGVQIQDLPCPVSSNTCMFVCVEMVCRGGQGRIHVSNPFRCTTTTLSTMCLRFSSCWEKWVPGRCGYPPFYLNSSYRSFEKYLSGWILPILIWSVLLMRRHH